MDASIVGRAVALKAGDLLLVEAGETHEISNEGTEPLETLTRYVPPEYWGDTQPAAGGASRP